jgi:hypothetical protein
MHPLVTGPLTGPHEKKEPAMAQKSRTIHPADAQDERLANLPLSAAYTYAYLPTILDDDGRARYQPALFNGYLWPLRADEHSTAAMVADIDALVEAGLLCRYSISGQEYLHDPSWKARQKIARPIPSTLPACPTHDKTFDDVVAETLNKVSEQVNTFLGATATTIDEAKIRDSVARIVEDVTFLVDPEKAASYGQKVRGFFARSTRPAGGPSALAGGPAAPAGEPPAPDAGGNGRSVWKDATDQPPSA